jgi:hypothetical protein
MSSGLAESWQVQKLNHHISRERLLEVVVEKAAACCRLARRSIAFKTSGE